MASRFYQCICGGFASIDMFAWLSGKHIIACSCGKMLDADASLFGFSLSTAKYAWRRYMNQLIKESKTMSKLTDFIQEEFLYCKNGELEEVLDGSVQQLKDLKDLTQLEIDAREKAQGE